MPADALAPKISSTSADMVLALTKRQHVVLFQSYFHLLESSQIQDTIQNENISFVISKHLSMLWVKSRHK